MTKSYPGYVRSPDFPHQPPVQTMDPSEHFAFQSWKLMGWPGQRERHHPPPPRLHPLLPFTRPLLTPRPDLPLHQTALRPDRYHTPHGLPIPLPLPFPPPLLKHLRQIRTPPLLPIGQHRISLSPPRPRRRPRFHRPTGKHPAALCVSLGTFGCGAGAFGEGGWAWGEERRGVDGGGVCLFRESGRGDASYCEGGA